ncbi:hypothetical protein CTI12_AA565320 [Artemisia annua]|uniref:Uncharacterized protein n=1 Tax=Artemisia annua TaxID=35608 RepID=A0A2U1KUR5_ARTAN|nr:hypothetical protein CTI12_AA565320 [Artemisia annua]
MGFVEAYKKKGKGKLQGTYLQVDGIRFQKPKVSYYYRPVTKSKNGGASTSKPSVQSNTGSPTVNASLLVTNLLLILLVVRLLPGITRISTLLI